MSNHKKTLPKELSVAGILIYLHRKKIKNIHLRILPPSGEVHLSVPEKCTLETISHIIEQRKPWIQKHQTRIAALPTYRTNTFHENETHFFFGKPYQLRIIETTKKPFIELNEAAAQLILFVSPHFSVEKYRALLLSWYRIQLKNHVLTRLPKWEAKMNVQINELCIKHMKTRWGTCNIPAKRIWLNSELAKKNPKCIEFVLVHELVHLFERYHNAHFYALMDRFLPDWRIYHTQLKSSTL